MITKTFISKSDDRVAVAVAKPRIQALENVLSRPNSIDDLLSATKQLGKSDRSYEVASVMAATVLLAAIVFVVFPVLNLAVPPDSAFHVSAFGVTLGGKIMCYMIVAIAMVHGRFGFWMNWTDRLNALNTTGNVPPNVPKIGP